MKNIILLSIIVGSVWAYGHLRGSRIEVPAQGGRTVKIDADSIRAICEMNGASQEVTVFFDTTWVAKKENLKVMGYSIALFEEDEMQRYAESRSWLVKAGTSSVRVENSGDKQFVVLAYPEITSCQELEDKFVILAHSGSNWNPTTVHLHVARSRGLAEKKAVQMRIRERAAESVETNLRAILPNTVFIKWEVR